MLFLIFSNGTISELNSKISDAIKIGYENNPMFGLRPLEILSLYDVDLCINPTDEKLDKIHANSVTSGTCD